MSNLNFFGSSVNGVFWTFIDVIFNKLSFFIALIFIARILGPEVYGIIGMVTIFITIGNSLVDGGMSISLIRSPEINRYDISNVFICNLLLSIIVYIVFYISAPYISNFYNQEIIIQVIRVYCLIFIITAFRAIHSALLIRRLEFRKSMLISIPSSLIGILVGVFLAMNEYGIWSIVFMYLTQQFVLTVCLWFISKDRIVVLFNWDYLSKHFKFGYKLTLSGLLNTACNNLNNVIIGRMYPLSFSGFYERAYSLNQYPSTVLTAIISKVTLPIISRIQEDVIAVRSILKKIIRYTFFIMSFIMLNIIVFANDIVFFILGKDWLPSVPYLQLLSLGSLFLPIHMFNINILQAYGRSDLFLKAEFIKKIFQVISILFLMKLGVFWLVSSLVFLSIFELFINAHYVNIILKKNTMIEQLSVYYKELIFFIVILGLSFFSEIYIDNHIEIKIGIFLLILIAYLLYSLIYFKKEVYFLKNNIIKRIIW